MHQALQKARKIRVWIRDENKYREETIGKIEDEKGWHEGSLNEKYEV